MKRERIGQFLSTGIAAGALSLALVFPPAAALAAEPGSNAERALLEKYSSIKDKLEKNQFGAPIYLESTDSEGKVRVDMYGVVPHPFDTAREALQSPESWCDITSLHINIKACTFKTSTRPQQVTLYSGRKYYQPPSDAYPLKFTFAEVSQTPRFLEVRLEAEEGPFRTKDHRITLKAAPLNGATTLLHFSYTYSQGAVARMAINGYFSTIGHGKVGFSEITEKGGESHLVEGVRGAVERNTMRYYLALQTYLDTLKSPQKQRFEQRISRWYDLTAKYARQLKENDKSSYLAAKRMERNRQVELQKKLGN
uniref:Uncharacterized protein n=1 Tax=Geobacter sp. (strain M21) TaxID=443144 RepID=C6E880_GEOSM